MSFEQYGTFPGAPGQDSAPGPGPVTSPQDGAMTGMPNMAGELPQQSQFPPQPHQADGSDNAAGQGNEGKTTLW